MPCQPICAGAGRPCRTRRLDGSELLYYSAAVHRQKRATRAMPFKLPPMNSLRLFEAAGRLGSFKSAADELHLTPSAVSHGIQTLEEWLGTPLFLRGARGLTLTEAGVSYLAVVRDVLARLDAATRTTQGGDPKETVRLSVTPTF